jgi:ABC-type bacteriocin/lantibiotic exporter with double-glycine peptidase domain
MPLYVLLLLPLLVTPEESLRFTYANKQGFDTSCGVAVTASLLNNYWNTSVTEPELYQGMILDRITEEDAAYTVSLLHIAEYIKTHGIQSRSYKMDWDILADTLTKGYAPIIINYDKPTPHFALLLHLRNTYAFVADPARGFEFVDKKSFEKNYSGYAMLTASASIQKNAAQIERIVRDEEKRLNRLEDLARYKGRRL